MNMRSISDDQLSGAVAASRSWRDVLRRLGLPESSSRMGRLLRERADALGIRYEHFSGQRRWSDTALVRAVAAARTWGDLLDRLGYQGDNGIARDTVRTHCERLAIDLGHLDDRASTSHFEPLAASRAAGHLGSAGSLLVAAFLQLAGHRICWPLEPAPYDLLVDAGSGQLLRVQVKTTTHRRGASWVCDISRATYDSTARWGQRQIYFSGEVDYFGIVDGDLDIYLIPFAVVAGRYGVSLAKYRRFRMGHFAVPDAIGA